MQAIFWHKNEIFNQAYLQNVHRPACRVEYTFSQTYAFPPSKNLPIYNENEKTCLKFTELVQIIGNKNCSLTKVQTLILYVQLFFVKCERKNSANQSQFQRYAMCIFRVYMCLCKTKLISKVRTVGEPRPREMSAKKQQSKSVPI